MPTLQLNLFIANDRQLHESHITGNEFRALLQGVFHGFQKYKILFAFGILRTQKLRPTIAAIDKSAEKEHFLRLVAISFCQSNGMNTLS